MQAVGIGSGAAAAASATAAIKWITKDAVGVAGRLLVGGGAWGNVAVVEALWWAAEAASKSDGVNGAPVLLCWLWRRHCFAAKDCLSEHQEHEW